jgi:hypothetical protein
MEAGKSGLPDRRVNTSITSRWHLVYDNRDGENMAGAALQEKKKR